MCLIMSVSYKNQSRFLFSWERGQFLSNDGILGMAAVRVSRPALVVKGQQILDKGLRALLSLLPHLDQLTWSLSLLSFPGKIESRWELCVHRRQSRGEAQQPKAGLLALGWFKGHRIASAWASAPLSTRRVSDMCLPTLILVLSVSE